MAFIFAFKTHIIYGNIYLIFARRPLPYLNMGGDELPF